MSSPISLIVGLGNPGQQYENTRHNAGVWFIDQLARQFSAPLAFDKKFHGDISRASIAGQDVRLLFPTTYMNKSGLSVAAVCHFFKIAPENVLVAHDELDLAPGTIRLKTGGGHGGHNGLRDIIQSLGNNKNFQRLRIGVGHPGDSKQVTGHVLSKAPSKEQSYIEEAISEAVRDIEAIVSGDSQKVMNQLHRFNAGA